MFRPIYEKKNKAYTQEVTLHCKSNCYLGCDISYPFKITVNPCLTEDDEVPSDLEDEPDDIFAPQMADLPSTDDNDSELDSSDDEDDSNKSEDDSDDE